MTYTVSTVRRFLLAFILLGGSIGCASGAASLSRLAQADKLSSILGRYKAWTNRTWKTRKKIALACGVTGITSLTIANVLNDNYRIPREEPIQQALCAAGLLLTAASPAIALPIATAVLACGAGIVLLSPMQQEDVFSSRFEQERSVVREKVILKREMARARGWLDE